MPVDISAWVLMTEQ